MEGFEIVLGQGGFLPGFEEQLIGIQAGEKKQIIIMVSHDLRLADLFDRVINFNNV